MWWLEVQQIVPWAQPLEAAAHCSDCKHLLCVNDWMGQNAERYFPLLRSIQYPKNTKNNKLVVDLHRDKNTLHTSVNIQGMDIDIEVSFKYLGVHLNWLEDTEVCHSVGSTPEVLLRFCGGISHSQQTGLLICAD